MILDTFKINDKLYDTAINLYEKKVAALNEHDIGKIRDIRKTVHSLFEECKFVIKKLGKHDIAIEKWKELKWKCFKIENQITEHLTVLERREQLFQNVELPQIPYFSQQLSNIVIDYPHLQSEIEHFEQVLKTVMRLDQSTICEKDILRLRGFLEAIQKIEKLKNSEINGCVERLLDTLSSSLSRKQVLLKQLKDQCPMLKPFSEWDDESKISFLVQAEQILNNPFEPKFDLQDLLKNEPTLLSLVINKETTNPKKKKNYWDWMPPLERLAFEIADTPKKKQFLIKKKTEGLKKLALPIQENDISNHLIVGAGPAGLIHALCFQMLGRKFQIIEKRKEDKTPRPNTVTLGKWETKELEILFFLGVIHRMEKKISFGHNRPYYNEIRLGDLEDALLEITKELNKGMNPVQYETTLSAINKDSNNETHCTLINKSEHGTVVIKPSTVIVADGFNGATKGLLGIETVKLAKSTLVHFSIFEKYLYLKNKVSIRFQYKAVSIAKGVSLILKMTGIFFRYRKSFEETYALAVDGGPTGLSRLPSQDYLLRVLKKDEQALINQRFQKKLKLLQLKIKKHANNEKRLHKLHQQQTKLLSKKEDYLTHRAEGKHGMFDFLHMLFRPQGHRMQSYPMKHKQNFLVDVQISNAEQSLVKVGNTTFLIRGDACHVTDPYSGTGCKTALEETLADQYFLKNSTFSNVSSMELAILNWGQDHYQQKMINKGFEERFMYYRDTEKATRFIEQAKKHNLIDAKQGEECLRLLAKREHAFPLLDEEQEFMTKLADDLIQILGKFSRKPVPIFVDDGWKMKEATLTKKEKKLFHHACTALNNTKQFPYYSPKTFSKLKTIAAKFSCDADERGPLLYLIMLLNM